MILFNTTFAIDNNRRKEFIDFLTTHYVPSARSAGLDKPLLSAVRAEAQLNTLTGNMSSCIALQLTAPSQQCLTAFRRNSLDNIYRRIGADYGEAVSFFETELDIIPLS